MSEKLRIGFGICGSFCTHSRALNVMKTLSESYTLFPIISDISKNTDTRFGKSNELVEKMTEICGRKPIDTVKDAEPLGPSIPLDAMLICPCTGNTLAKLAHGITDNAVTMAAKATARCNRPVIIALATNDALGANLENIGRMYNKKNVYFVPLSQDDSINKPYSLVCDFALTEKTLQLAIGGKQIQPFLK